MFRKPRLKGAIALRQVLWRKEHLVLAVHGCQIACILASADTKLCEDHENMKYCTHCYSTADRICLLASLNE